ncbi:DUF7220 family protein [Bradyrhizobium erythrophlei]|uniref:DUF7220 family protein n=1 Tax=Bradyrhizobium erythrophlei TaxID=1437360 RepID=UPI003CC80511
MNLQSFAITLIFTIISVVRSYLVRRFCETYVRHAWCQEVYDCFFSTWGLT